ncbi:MAG: hypothetical protein KAQ92_02995 [Candidatus Aenigmarchaeota archaeon]|nr:hypothetical protein [Candidatus Aenigmarchaeota archaeon]
MQCNNQNIKDKLFLYSSISKYNKWCEDKNYKQATFYREDDFNCLFKSIENNPLNFFEIRNILNYRMIRTNSLETTTNESILSSVVGDKNTVLLSKNGGTT